jgi:hypothetical protein
MPPALRSPEAAITASTTLPEPAAPPRAPTVPLPSPPPALAWACRVLLAALLAMSYAGSVVVVGFLYRWVQARVLYTWWRRSPVRGRLSFTDFCADQGPDGPRLCPRLLFREPCTAEEARRQIEVLPAHGEPHGQLRQLALRSAHPLRSLWLNARTGMLGLFATFLLSGWGGLLMAFSWEYGWNASFDKAHEVARVGPLTGWAGVALFVAAMVYVPMAQVHQAVTGDFRAFFEFRFVWRLIRACPRGYVFFAALFLDFAVALEILKMLPTGFDDHLALFRNASDVKLLWLFRGYYLGCSLYLVLSLLATRLVIVHLYAGAVIEVLRHSPAAQAELHPRLAAWLDRLELPTPVSRPARRGWHRLPAQAALFVVLLAVWFAFVAKVYVSEFFNYHPVVGFVNHPMIQAPCCNYVPAHLGTPWGGDQARTTDFTGPGPQSTSTIFDAYPAAAAGELPCSAKESASGGWATS